MPVLTQLEAAPRDFASKVSLTNAVFYTGRDAVLAQAALLEELAERCGQPGAMHGLAYVLDHEYAARKLPHLVLLFPENARVDRLPMGAVLLFEYCAGPLKTGILTTGDSFGVRTVIGPEQLRPSIAAAACSAFLARRASLVLVSFKQPAETTLDLSLADPSEHSALWAVQTRTVQDHLPLGASYEATLARIGKRTRTHLRYYRRRLEEAVPFEFLPEVRGLIDFDDAAALKRLNRNSLGPISQDAFDLQYRMTARLPGGFVSGLRAKTGAWLSLAGGWRQGGTTWVQWQMNTAGFEAFSLSTVLRSFLIEAEVERGTRQLAFHGGTSHSMGHAFPVERVVDLIARRPGVYPELVTRLASWLYSALPALRSRGNFLADALREGGLRWHSTAGLPQAFQQQLELALTASATLK